MSTEAHSVLPHPRLPWFTLISVGLLLVLVYLPALRGQWTWDDDVHVWSNILLRDARGLFMIWTRLGATPQYYPLTHTSFWIEWRLFGNDPTGYHVVSLLLHAASALLLWRTLKWLNLRAAGVIAVIWALHPLQVETVAWISERKNTLSAVTYFAAAYAFLRSENAGESRTSSRRTSVSFYALSLLCFAGAVLSKTVAGLLPAALLLVLWWKRSLSRRAVLKTLPMFCLSIVMGRVTAYMEREYVGAHGPDWDFSFAERLLIALRAVAHYVSKILWPAHLSFIYPRWPIDVTNATQWLFPVALVLVTFLFLFLAWKGRRGPAAGWLFFLGTVFPALGFVNIYPMRYSFAADHFQYLAGVGVIALVCEGARELAEMKNLTARLSGVTVLVIFALGQVTRAHANDFASPQTLWRATLGENPQAWIALDHLAAAALDRGDVDTASAYYGASLRVKNHVEAHLGLADVLERQGRFDEALVAYRQAVDVQPRGLLPHHQLGLALTRCNDFAAAAVEFQTVLDLDPRFEPARLQLAQLEQRRGRYDRATELYRTGIQLFPDSAQCRVQWADLLMSTGHPREAIDLYEQALNLQPTSKPLTDRIKRARAAK